MPCKLATMQRSTSQPAGTSILPARLSRGTGWLALAAALLLAFAPSISRVVASPASAATGTSQASCHEEATGHAQHPAPAEDHHGQKNAWGEEGHCAYCPLASHTPGTSSFQWAPQRDAFHAIAPPAFVTARLPASTNTRGLGSQAPPARG